MSLRQRDSFLIAMAPHILFQECATVLAIRLAVQDCAKLFAHDVSRYCDALGNFSVDVSYPVEKKIKEPMEKRNHQKKCQCQKPKRVCGKTRSETLGKPYKQIVSNMHLALGLTDATTRDHLQSCRRSREGTYCDAAFF